MKRVCLAAFAAVLAAFALPASAQVMSQSQAQSLLRGFTVDGRSDRLGGAGTFAFNHDGTLAIELRAPDRSRIRGRGTYRFANGGFCATAPLLGAGERCFTLRRASRREVHIIAPDGSLEAVLTTEATGP